jgi:hypothetical protein
MIKVSDEKDDKEESTSITTHTRKRNIVPGLDNEHLAIGTGLLALGGVAYLVLKPHFDIMMQNMNLAKQQQTPPPPAPPVEAQATVSQPVNEYVDEAPEQTIKQPNGQGGVEPDNSELQEVDHKNYQQRRNPRRSSESPFGSTIQNARG